MRIGSKTPWGKADSVKHLGSGVYLVETPSHGGIYLDDPSLLPLEITNTFTGKQWAEEDCEMSCVIAMLFDKLDLSKAWNSPQSKEEWMAMAKRNAKNYRDNYGAWLKYM